MEILNKLSEHGIRTVDCDIRNKRHMKEVILEDVDNEEKAVQLLEEHDYQEHHQSDDDGRIFFKPA